ncbi:MAG: hypothetical protein EYC70_12355 [Planctomycetota bacterium]|nr:MAG: hypothetical protein EYC70_12355 [Planctomycetota bacterium]
MRCSWLTTGSLLVLAFPAACSKSARDDSTDAPLPMMVRVLNADEPLPDLSYSGVVLDILPGVRYECTITSTSGGESQELATLNGHSFELQGDHLSIGPRRYGPLQSGDRVTVSAEGVAINGVPAGPLPPR